jgi:hypothetical protein
MLDDMSALNNSRKIPFKIYNFQQKRNFGFLEIDSNVSWVSAETSVEWLKVSVDFSERNASVAKTRTFSLLCKFTCHYFKNLAEVSGEN